MTTINIFICLSLSERKNYFIQLKEDFNDDLIKDKDNIQNFIVIYNQPNLFDYSNFQLLQ